MGGASWVTFVEFLPPKRNLGLNLIVVDLSTEGEEDLSSESDDLDAEFERDRERPLDLSVDLSLENREVIQE